MLTVLVFLSGFLLSAAAAYYSIVGLIAIFPGATFAIAAMGTTLEMAKLVAVSWLYRNWKESPLLLKTYLSIAVVLLMFITSMGVFGFLSKSHIEHQTSINSDSSSQLETLNSTIESREKSIKLIERQLNGIDSSLEKYLESGQVTRGLTQKRRLDAERKQLEVQRQAIENELIGLKTERNELSAKIQKIEVEVGPLKYIAELIYGQEAKDHFDSAVRFVIILIIIVFDPLAVMLLMAGNFSLYGKQEKPVDIKPKRKYTRRKPLAQPVMEVKEDNFGIEPIDKPHIPTVLR